MMACTQKHLIIKLITREL